MEDRLAGMAMRSLRLEARVREGDNQDHWLQKQLGWLEECVRQAERQEGELKGRVFQLEQRVAALDGMEQRLVLLEKRRRLRWPWTPPDSGQ